MFLFTSPKSHTGLSIVMFFLYIITYTYLSIPIGVHILAACWSQLGLLYWNQQGPVHINVFSQEHPCRKITTQHTWFYVFSMLFKKLYYITHLYYQFCCELPEYVALKALLTWLTWLWLVPLLSLPTNSSCYNNLLQLSVGMSIPFK